MILWKLLPFSRRVAFVYLLAISVLFLLHFKIADDFTYKHIRNYSEARCRFGCFRDLEFYKLFSVNAHPAFYSRLNSIKSVSQTQWDDNLRGEMLLSSRPSDLVGVSKDFDGDIKDVVNKTDKTELLYTAPRGEHPIQRFPQSVIIGFTKCGTRALIEFMSLHPYIQVARNEVHFYDRDENFVLGYEWYKDQMPLTYSNQVTLEKTPAYVLTQRARDGMYQLSPNVKLILLIRDPVVRLVSQYLLRFRVGEATTTHDPKPVSAIYTNFSTGKFDPNLRPVDIGNYQKHIAMWLEKFSFHQLLIINSEDLTRDPLRVIKRVEAFLNVPRMFSEFNVYFNKTSGFYCPRGFEPTSTPRCLGKSKGLTHPKLSSRQTSMLYEYYKPHNEKLFSLLGYRLNWTEKQWGKEE